MYVFSYIKNVPYAFRTDFTITIIHDSLILILRRVLHEVACLSTCTCTREKRGKTATEIRNSNHPYSSRTLLRRRILTRHISTFGRLVRFERANLMVLSFCNPICVIFKVRPFEWSEWIEEKKSSSFIALFDSKQNKNTNVRAKVLSRLFRESIIRKFVSANIFRVCCSLFLPPVFLFLIPRGKNITRKWRTSCRWCCGLSQRSPSRRRQCMQLGLSAKVLDRISWHRAFPSAISRRRQFHVSYIYLIIPQIVFEHFIALGIWNVRLDS